MSVHLEVKILCDKNAKKPENSAEVEILVLANIKGPKAVKSYCTKVVKKTDQMKKKAPAPILVVLPMYY